MKHIDCGYKIFKIASKYKFQEKLKKKTSQYVIDFGFILYFFIPFTVLNCFSNISYTKGAKQ